jgi:copper homeostasis protein
MADKLGAGRIELCSDPAVGGTTPSHGLIAYALAHVCIPVFPMIRPRGGNFVYDEHELAVMHRDIISCKQLGCKGIATGVLLPDDTVDIETMKRIVGWAYPMHVTFHKAFDRTTEPEHALEAVIEAGCTTLLTSGLQKTAIEGAHLLQKLVAQAGGRLTIMPGGGVRSSNIGSLITATGADVYHSSCLLPGSKDQIADANELTGLVAQINTASVRG